MRRAARRSPALLLDGGSTVSLAGLPTDSDLTVTNGTTLDAEGNAVNLNSLTVTGGSIIDGSLNVSGACTLDDATIGADLTAASLTAADLVSLSGTDSIGTVLVDSTSDELDVDGSLTSSGGVTNNGTLNVNGTGTLDANVADNGALGFYVSNNQAFAGNLSGEGSFTPSHAQCRCLDPDRHAPGQDWRPGCCLSSGYPEIETFARMLPNSGKKYTRPIDRLCEMLNTNWTFAKSQMALEK